VIRELRAGTLPEKLLLNVNLPAGRIRGVRWTRLGYRRYRQVVVEKVDPRGRKYYWIAGTPEWREEDGTDYSALAAGYASVTPLHLDLTDYRMLEAGSDTLPERLLAAAEGWV
jgi:5'-nucleotidase